MRLIVSMAVGVLGACGAEPLPRAAPRPVPVPDGLPALRVAGPLSGRLASYDIEARLDARAHRVTGQVRLSWRHDGVEPVTRVPVHLYLNAFKNEDTVFLSGSGGAHRGNEITPGKWGWIELDSIRRGDVDLAQSTTWGEDETLLWIDLGEPARPGDTLELTMPFTAQLPEALARTGYKDEFIMVAQWFPKIGVLDVVDGRQSWAAEEFHLNSEFYADFGVYDVRLDVPDTHLVAATGVLVHAEAHEPGRHILTYRAEDVHDFAFLADPYMQVMTGRAELASGPPVTVRVVHRPRQERFARRHLAAAIAAVEIHSERLVPYPWSIMTVIDPPPSAASSAGGMEYPTLVTTSGDSAFTPEGVYLPEFVTIHEVGHNWFQGILASNEVQWAWLDEGVNQYFNGVVLELWKGPGATLIDRGGFTLDFFAAMQTRTDASLQVTPIDTPSYRFASFSDYASASYGKTGVALRTLEQIVGPQRFRAALGVYARRFAFGHPRPEDLWTTLSEATGQDLSWFHEPAFSGRGTVDLRVASLDVQRAAAPRGVFGRGETRHECPGAGTACPGEPEGGWQSDALLVNLGSVPVVTEVELTFEDGRIERRVWDGRDGAFFHRLRVVGPHPVTGVRLDPRDRLVLEHERVRNGKSELDVGPVGRAAGNIAFWEQTLLQMVGL